MPPGDKRRDRGPIERMTSMALFIGMLWIIAWGWVSCERVDTYAECVKAKNAQECEKLEP